jgi:histidine phosphotransferase ChpT
MNAVDLASLLCSRLCHDLMSPVGALNNGIELLADEQDPEMRERCLELLAESARASANKLKFFRLAFGAAGGFGDGNRHARSEAALEGLFGAERRIELGWMVDGRQAAQGRGQAAAQPRAARRRRAGARRPARRRRREQRRRRLELVIRAEGPAILLDPELRETLLTGAAPAARSSRARPAPGWRTAWRRAGGSIQLSDPSSEVLMIGRLSLDRDNAR